MSQDRFNLSELSPLSEWREVSDGGYSEVYKAHLLGHTVAVKQATSRKKTSGEALLREIRCGPTHLGTYSRHAQTDVVSNITRLRAGT